MRTTVTLADDVSAAVEQTRRERSIGVSEAVNELIRAGLSGGAQPRRRRFEQQTQPIALRVDVANVAEAIETLDGPDAP
jgi:hypothetical protein